MTNAALLAVCPFLLNTPHRNSARAQRLIAFDLQQKRGPGLGLRSRKGRLAVFDGDLDPGKISRQAGDCVLLQGGDIAVRGHIEVAFGGGFPTRSVVGASMSLWVKHVCAWRTW